jgi:hypothetical protein
MKLKGKGEFDVTITKAGDQTAHARVGHQLAGSGAAAFVGNALIGGVIGAGVDAADGSTMELKPNPLIVTLTPDTAPAPPTPPVVAPAFPPARSLEDHALAVVMGGAGGAAGSALGTRAFLRASLHTDRIADMTDALVGKAAQRPRRLLLNPIQPISRMQRPHGELGIGRIDQHADLDLGG